MNINDVVAAKVEAARRKAAADKERRRAQQQARNAGLGQRHAAKLRHLAQEKPVPVRVDTCPACRTERVCARVGSATVNGHPVVLIQCPQPRCELVWAVQPDRTPAAA